MRTGSAILLTLLIGCSDKAVEDTGGTREAPTLETSTAGDTSGDTAEDTGTTSTEETGTSTSGAPDLTMDPAALDFGELPVGCTSPAATVTLRNTGGDDLTLSEVTLTDDAFSMSAVALPVTLVPGDAIAVSLQFSPSALTDYAGSLSVTSNDPDDPTDSTALTGVGLDSLVVDSFTQEKVEALDLLWVIDNSASMSSSSTHLASKSDIMLDYLDGVDFHIGVVTTDMDDDTQSGILQGAPTFLDESTATASNLELRIAQGERGAPVERGLAATQAALSEPLIDDENVDFLRDDVPLLVSLLSNENDQSAVPVEAFVDWFLDLKADPADLSFSAITGPALGCAGAAPWGSAYADAGTRYLDAVDALSGVAGSFCDSNYGDSVDAIFREALGGFDTVEMSQKPDDIDAIEVTIDGDVILMAEEDGWTYDADANSVTFHGDAWPEFGAEVEITYTTEAGECP